MKNKVLMLVLSTILATFLLTSCGEQADTGNETQEETVTEEMGTAEEEPENDAPESEVSEPEEEPAAEETAEPEAETAEEEEETTAETNDAYAWLGLSDMPKCNYLDLVSQGRYICTYDYYVMGLIYEETEAVDGIDSVKTSETSRTYSIDGKIVSMDENSKMYSEYEMGDTYTAAVENLQNAMNDGTNIYGRSPAGTGKGVIPLYSDSGDDAEYEYYEYNYPETESATGIVMTERFYMKDGDVFAIYNKTGADDTAVESTKVIKEISPDIPEGTFEMPSLDGYSKIEI